ncbi:MAG TPA: hypothetical protein VGC86_05030 [Afipia sp.]
MPNHQCKPQRNDRPASAETPVRSHLPRQRIDMSDGQIVDHMHRLGYTVKIGQIGFTIESVADFMDAREKYWSKVGTVRIYEPPGLLVIENAKPREMQPIRDVVVVSLGYARAVIGVMNPDPAAPTPRYARYME